MPRSETLPVNPAVLDIRGRMQLGARTNPTTVTAPDPLCHDGRLDHPARGDGLHFHRVGAYTGLCPPALSRAHLVNH
jgi:hypothetical protein